MDRREFLSLSSQAALGAAAASAAFHAMPAQAAPNDRVVVCVAGVRGRGNSLLNTFARLPQVDVKYVCDLDETVLGSRTDQIEKIIGRRPQTIKDFRQALDDDQVDALVLGTPDHWHAIPTIMACQAGKDVYVEKPDGHNAIEGKTMVDVARRHSRIVQLGTQARSGKHIPSLLEYLQAGNIGKALFAKAWESSQQRGIGHPSDTAPPAGVDYDTWLGPAPKRPFNPARFHGSWRWFFDYGTGDLGNDGVHRLDLARMALQAATEGRGEKPLGFPQTISSVGGKYYFDDDQQFPDVLQVNYEYAGKTPKLLTYEMRTWSAYHTEGEPEGAAVFGDGGYVIIGNGRWRAFDRKGKQIREEQAGYNDSGHAQNFIDCMHSRAKPAADLETVGHPASLLCHLGNCAWRAGRTLKFDLGSYTFVGDDDANRYLTRPEYRKPWVLEEIAKG